ncbi:MAG: DUF5666 domain-containing protein [Aeromicrobium sp.]
MPSDEQPTQDLPDSGSPKAETLSTWRTAFSGVPRAALAAGSAILIGIGLVGGYAINAVAGEDTRQHRSPFGYERGNAPHPGDGRHPGEGRFPGGGQGPADRPGPNLAGNATIGTVSSVDGNTITLKTVNGDTVKITASSGTKVTINKTGKVSDLSDGDTVVVQGTKDNDGNVTAKSIDEGGFGGFRGGQPPAN